MQEFITCYNSSNRHKWKETWSAEGLRQAQPDKDQAQPDNQGPKGRWRKFGYDEINCHDKTSLDITCLKDKSLADLNNLPDPDV